MGWANEHIAKLKAGKPVTFRPFGNSMSPVIESGQEVTCYPVNGSEVLGVGDIVLCSVGNSQYLHFIKEIRFAQEHGSSGFMFLIGNNKGSENGWIDRENIYGKYFAGARLYTQESVLDKMQTPEFTKAAQAAFDASPEELGKAAVQAAKPKKRSKKTKV